MTREYKDSGIEWIGRIPKEWITCKLKHITHSMQSGGTPTSGNTSFYNDNGTPWVAIGDMHHCGEILSTQKHLTEEGLHDKSLVVFPRGTLLYSIYASIGKVSILSIPAAINQAILAISLKENANQAFYKFVLVSMEQYVLSLANGNTQFNLNSWIVANFIVPTPPFSEQQQISEHLEGKCGEIDGLIALQEQMIAQLTDYKQSVITEAVTKGLNPSEELVPSGIDWIDAIPKGWGNVRFYYSNWIRGRLGWKGLKSEEYTESGYPFLSAFNIINNKLDWSDINYINQERYDESPEIKLNVGDILLVKDGAGIGKCARIDELPLGESTVNSSLAVITPKAFLNYKYLYYYLQSNSFWSIINLLLVGMGVRHLTQTNMKNIKMPLPSLEEQIAIAEYLDAKCDEIDKLIETKRLKIETLKEYKKSIIYEAVTGKTDLRDS